MSDRLTLPLCSNQAIDPDDREGTKSRLRDGPPGLGRRKSKICGRKIANEREKLNAQRIASAVGLRAGSFGICASNQISSSTTNGWLSVWRTANLSAILQMSVRQLPF